ncbi:MAG: 50S ribosomal protein L9 [Candidatus Pacebacteria bacterium]|nr:50S ribosomal protein L9 [Candidatus Paceibacterota bacterium]
MKVILLQNVARIGQKFEVKDVPDGHALNFLIPRKLAEPATAHSLRRLQKKADKTAADTATADAAFTALLETLGGESVSLAVEANEQGHLFKGIKAEDIAAHMATLGHAVAATAIVLDTPIKEVGAHDITLTHGAHTGVFTLTVTKK